MPSTGTLLVRVYSSAAQLPIQGACVRVLAKTATGQRVLAVRTTDSSGLIEPVTLEAEPAANSLTPGHAEPFASVDVTVAHPYFLPIDIRGIQIFSGIRSIQDIMLLPLEERPADPNAAENVTIPAQEL